VVIVGEEVLLLRLELEDSREQAEQDDR